MWTVNRYAPHSSAEAQRHGVAAIYQEPMIFPDLNVAENIFIGHEDRGWVVDCATWCAEAERILADLGIAVDPQLRRGPDAWASSRRWRSPRRSRSTCAC